MPGADGRKRDQDRHTDKCACNAPEHAPEEYRKQHHERGNRNGSSCHTRFDIAADDELKKIETDEHNERGVQRLKLGGREQRRQQGRNKRADEGYEVEDEGDYPPTPVVARARRQR